MANALYDKGREAFATGQINWLSDTIKCVLVSNSYTPNLATHQYLSDIPSSARVKISSAFTNKTATNGVCDADDITLTSVPSGQNVTYVVIYKDTGTDSTSRLIALLDTMSGLPMTTSGADIIIQWSNDANKIFKL
jgi:hypothetical protein